MLRALRAAAARCTLRPRPALCARALISHAASPTLQTSRSGDPLQAHLQQRRRQRCIIHRKVAQVHRQPQKVLLRGLRAWRAWEPWHGVCGGGGLCTVRAGGGVSREVERSAVWSCATRA